MKKKVYSLIIITMLLFNLCSNLVVSAASANTNTKDTIPVEDVNSNTGGTFIKAEFVKEENGVKTYKARIPITWVSTAAEDTNSSKTTSEVESITTKAVSDCDMVMQYWGNGVWYCGISYSAFDLLKTINATCSTYGIGGSTSKNISGKNFIPGPIITADAEFHYLHPTKSGWQYFKVSGTVTGVNGYGSFGPTVSSIYVEVN